MIKQIRFKDGIRTIHYYTDCPDDVGIELKTIVGEAKADLNTLLDETYAMYHAEFPAVTRPNLYFYIYPEDLGEVNAFTDSRDIFLSVASLVSMHSFIRERLDTTKIDGSSLVPEGMEVTASVYIYRYILRLIVAHELTHIWHRHGLWRRNVLQTADSHWLDGTVFSEQVRVEALPEAADLWSPEALVTTGGKLKAESQWEANYIQQILEIDSDCCAVCIVLAHLQREITRLQAEALTGDRQADAQALRGLLGYHSFMLGMVIGAAGILCGFFDSLRAGKPFDRLSQLLSGDHPVPALRFTKMHMTLLTMIHRVFEDDDLANLLLSQTNAFAIDIFMHDGSTVSLGNCFWAPAQTREGQSYLTFLERGWNLIRDSLQRYALLELPDKYTESEMQIYPDMIWFDRDGKALHRPGAN